MTPPAATIHPTILVIEPHAAVLKVLTLVLDPSRFEVLTAGSAQDGMLIDVSFPRTIHLLLSSITLPGTTGPEFAKVMKERRPEMRVMFMSSLPDGALLILNSGWSFVTKKLVAATLLSKIEDLLLSTTREQGMDGFDTRMKQSQGSSAGHA